LPIDAAPLVNAQLAMASVRAFSTIQSIAINLLQNCHFNLAKMFSVALSNILRDSAASFI
jgi:hypothetical protein